MPGDPADFTAKALADRGIVDSGQFIPQNTVNVGVLDRPMTRSVSFPAMLIVKSMFVVFL